MLQRLYDPHFLHFSPGLTGATSTAMIYLQLGLTDVLIAPVPRWVWMGGLLVFLTGMILQFATRRMLYLRLYHACVFFISSLVVAYLLWGLLTLNQGEPNRIVIGVLIGLIFIGSVWSGYDPNRHIKNFKTMPHGPIGLLNPKTGLIVPTRSPATSQTQIREGQNMAQMVLRFGPLITGLLAFIIKISSESSDLLLLAAVSLPWMILCARGAGTFALYAVSIIRWEEEHQKRIYVKRLKSHRSPT